MRQSPITGSAAIFLDSRRECALMRVFLTDANHTLKGKNFVADNVIIAEKIVANNIKKR